MEESVYKIYGNRLRVRGCGILTENDKILMINHAGLANDNFWSPPGGGVNFGETLHNCIEREFQEEAGLLIQVKELMFTCELLKPPLHAIEFFFRVEVLSGKLSLGKDPEMHDNQIIKDIRFLSWQEIDHLHKEDKHGIFNTIGNSSKIVDLKGHFKL